MVLVSWGSRARRFHNRSGTILQPIAGHPGGRLLPWTGRPGQLLLCDYVIVSESRFLEEIEAGHFQAVRVAIPSSLSFHDLTFVVAGLHFDEFIKRHPWLSELRIMEAS
jgi:hypothetical protein